ncbi:MAG: hypothetical protein SNH79_03765 [Rikenellaceae bacterium]
MIKIDIKNIEQIKTAFLNRINERMQKEGPPTKIATKAGAKIANELYALFQANLESIVLCEAKDMPRYEDMFFNECSGKKLKELKGFKIFKNYMKKQYTAFINKHGYWLAEELGVKVCPYCNRNYTSTIKKGARGQNSVRPQFDHFKAKSKYPFFALSFYNLIPSCPTCNHIKGEKEIEINPHEKGFADNCRFAIDKIDKCILNSDRKLWDIELQNQSNADKNVETFLLTELYNEHKDIAEEIVFKAQAYNEKYCEALSNNFKGLGLNDSDIKRIIFGNYVDTKDYGKRPLSKLTADILHQVDVKLPK